MKRGSTNFLRSVIILIGLVVLGLCVIALPQLISMELESNSDFDYGIIFLGLYLPAIPFFFALYQALKLLGFIDNNTAFSEKAINTLKNIKYSASVISGLFIGGMPYIFYVADRDDAPGVAALGFVIIGASIVIATFAAVLEKLLQNAADIKSENDLTV
jgi:hypothetical protein